MAVQTNTFKGARYIPKFYGDWTADIGYEAIGVVKHNAFTYISKQPVPAGVEIDNTDFWLLWADPNAQMEELRQIFMQYVDTVNDLSDVLELVDAALPISEFSAQNTVKDYIDKSAYTFDTFSDMVNSISDLNNGSVYGTRGYYEVGDGGHGRYLITNEMPTKEYYETAGGKYIVNIENCVLLSQWGVLPNMDVTTRLNEIIRNVNRNVYENNTVNYDANNVETTLQFGCGKYIVSAPLEIIDFAVNVKGYSQPQWYTQDFDEMGTTILYTATSGTCMKLIGRCGVNGITFLNETSLTYQQKVDGQGNPYGWTNHPDVIPWEPYEYTINYADVNALHFTGANNAVSNCKFQGFSGAGLTYSQLINVENCVFHKCNKAINSGYNSGALIKGCYISNCVNGIITTSTIRTLNCWFDAIIEHAIKSDGTQINGIINGCTFDHIGYAAIKAESSLHLNVNANFQKVGYYYAGISYEDAIALVRDKATVQEKFELLAKMSAIAIKNCRNVNVTGFLGLYSTLDSYVGDYLCPRFAIDAIEYSNSYVEYKRQSLFDGVYRLLESNYFHTKEGAADSSKVLTRLGCYNDGVSTYNSNVFQARNFKGIIDATDEESDITLATNGNRLTVYVPSTVPTGVYRLRNQILKNTSYLNGILFKGTTPATIHGSVLIAAGNTTNPYPNIIVNVEQTGSESYCFIDCEQLNTTVNP